MLQARLDRHDTLLYVGEVVYLARPDSVLSEEQVLMEEFDRLIREIGASVVDTSIKPVLLGVVQRLDTALTRVSEVVETGSKNIEALMADTDVAASLRQMAECAEALREASAEVASEHQSLAEAFQKIQAENARVVAELSSRVPDVAHHLAGLTDLLARLEALMSSLNETISTGVKASVDASETLRTKLDEMAKHIDEQGKCLQTAVSSLNALRDTITGTANAVEESVTGLITTNIQPLVGRMTTLEAVTAALSKAFVDLASQLQRSTQQETDDHSLLLRLVRDMRSDLSSDHALIVETLALGQRMSRKLSWTLTIMIGVLLSAAGLAYWYFLR